MKPQQPSLFKSIKIHVISGLTIALVSSSVAFAYSVQARVTVLEAALISISQDLRDIKGMLMSSDSKKVR